VNTGQSKQFAAWPRRTPDRTAFSTKRLGYVHAFGFFSDEYISVVISFLLQDSYNPFRYFRDMISRKPQDVVRMTKEPYIGHLFKLRCSKCVEVDPVQNLTINASEVLRDASISSSNYLYL